MRIIPTPYFKAYATLGTAIVCATDDPKGEKRNAIGLDAAVGGTAVVRPVWGAAGGADDVTLELLDGITRWVEFKEIVSGTATNVTIYWERGNPA